MATEWDIGDSPRLFADFVDIDGIPVNPTSVTLVVRKPDASLLTLTAGSLDNPAVGRFEYVLPIDMAGSWNGEWRGLGPDSVTPFDFIVRTSRIGPAPVGYTYDLATTIGKVRLYTDDRDLSSIAVDTPLEQRSAIWTDAELQVFLDDNAEDAHLAAADALTQLAGNRQLLVQHRKIGLTIVDYGSARSDMLKLAEAHRAIAYGTGVPADGVAEQVYDDFGMRRTITNSVLRNNP